MPVHLVTIVRRVQPPVIGRRGARALLGAMEDPGRRGCDGGSRDGGRASVTAGPLCHR